MNRFNPLLIICTILIETFFIAVINMKIYISENIVNLKSFLPFANLLILFLSGFAVISIRQIWENSKKEIESCLLRDHLQNIKDLTNSLYAQRHEHTRHIQTIQAMLYLDEIDKAKSYLDGIAEDYWNMQDLVYVGNTALTALLNSKRKVAEIKNIAFYFAVKCDISNIEVVSWDLCSIIGNLLDNALEAAVQDNKQPKVSLEIKHENNQFVIYVYNNGTRIHRNQQKKIFTPGYTSKKSTARGFGLYLVKKLVDKYEGTITLVSKPRTTFIVSLPDRSVNKYDKKNIITDSKSYRHTAANQCN